MDASYLLLKESVQNEYCRTSTSHISVAAFSKNSTRETRPGCLRGGAILLVDSTICGTSGCSSAHRKVLWKMSSKQSLHCGLHGCSGLGRRVVLVTDPPNLRHCTRAASRRRTLAIICRSAAFSGWFRQRRSQKQRQEGG